jgi:uncharacterized membrane protein required for colicin V production
MNDVFTAFKNLSWFDPIAFAVLVVGLLHGRKRGMSGELIDLAGALTMVAVPALYYDVIAPPLAKFMNMQLFWANIACYFAIVFAIGIVVGVIKEKLGSKLVGADVFGRMEFYFGMIAGMIRYACYLILFISFVHARQVSTATVEADIKKQEETIGMFVTSYGKIQVDVLYKSVVGGAVRQHLGGHDGQLIRPTALNQKSGDEKQWRGKTLDDVMKEK